MKRIAFLFTCGCLVPMASGFDGVSLSSAAATRVNTQAATAAASRAAANASTRAATSAAETVFLNLAIQCAFADAQQASRFFTVAVGQFQCALDVVFLDLVHGTPDQ